MSGCQNVADVLQAQTFEDMEERIRTMERRYAELEEINKDQKKRIQYYKELGDAPSWMFLTSRLLLLSRPTQGKGMS